MSELLPTLISYLQEYGYIALWLVLFCAAVGLPLPISLLLLAAGAFAALGDFNLLLLALVAASALITGDTIGYYLGRRVGGTVLDWLESQPKRRFLSPAKITKSRLYFQQHGSWAIFLSRFLFAGLGGTINLLAGAERYPYRRFLLYDISGELCCVSIPLSLGFIFGASWEAVGEILGTVTLLLLALLLVIYLLFQLTSMLRRLRQARALRKSQLQRTRRKSVDITREEPDILPL